MKVLLVPRQDISTWLETRQVSTNAFPQTVFPTACISQDICGELENSWVGTEECFVVYLKPRKHNKKLKATKYSSVGMLFKC